jgi:peptide/nickel transport system substrate-binding protein
MTVYQTAADVPNPPPAQGRLKRRSRAISLTARLSVLAGLLLACSPAAPPAPTSAPATQAPAAPAAKPTSAPAAPAAAPATAPAAKAPAAAATTAPATAPAAAAKPAPARVEPKGSVTLVLPEEPPMLAAHDATATFSYPIMRNVTEALLNRDPKTSELVPELATKWERVNPTTWRFTLRQGVKFHDGTPWNAEAAADGINDLWAKANNYRVRNFIGPELEAKAVSEYVVDVVTASPDPILPTRFYFAPFHSPTARKANPADVPLKPIGTGPYKFVEWVKGQHVKLEANPDWWGNTASDNGGAASIKEVTWIIRPEREVRTAMVQRGEADLARWVSKDQCNAAPVCKHGPTVETIFIRLDTMNPAMGDKRVRLAIALATDKDAIANGIMDGGELSGSMSRPNVFGTNKELKPYPYDPERAKALLAEAKAAGVPVDMPLTVLARRAAYFRIEEAAEALTDMLQKVGFNAKTQVLEVSKHTEIYNAPKPIDPARGIVAMHSHGNELLDYSRTTQYLLCETRTSSHCPGGNPDPVAEEMVKKAVTLDGAEREKAFLAIGQYWYDEVITIPVVQPSFYFAVSPRLEWTPREDGFIQVKEMKLKE